MERTSKVVSLPIAKMLQRCVIGKEGPVKEDDCVGYVTDCCDGCGVYRWIRVRERLNKSGINDRVSVLYRLY